MIFTSNHDNQNYPSYRFLLMEPLHTASLYNSYAVIEYSYPAAKPPTLIHLSIIGSNKKITLQTGTTSTIKVYL